MHHHLDAYTYTNRLRKISPHQKLGFAIVLLGIALTSHPISQIVLALWLGVWIVGYARIPLKVYLTLLMVTGFFWLTSLPALMLSVTSLDSIAAISADLILGYPVGDWFLFVSRRGLEQATQIGARSFACTSCLLFILLTIPFTDLLQVLRQWRFPILLTELLLLMYRFVFLFLDIVSDLQLAQKARGGYRTRQRWMYSVSLLGSQLLVRSLQHYRQFSLALATRGFQGEFRVFSHQSYCYSVRYGLESIVGCVGLVMLNFRF